jgi:hypothetical protein
MKIKFLVDYVGRETAMNRYFKDDEMELDQQPAIELINLEVAEEVKEFVPDNVGPRSKRKVSYDKDS